MTKEEITAKINLYETAIDNILLTGQEYVVGTGSSARTFKAADISKLEKRVDNLYKKREELTGCSGIVVGF